MSCHPETTYAVYVDGELPVDEARALEGHLVACRECRALVMALRDEAQRIADALYERAPREARAALGARAAPPARGFAIGLVPALGLAALGFVALGALFEARPPGAVAWLNPLRLTGAYEMVFDLIFALRDRAPGLLELAVSGVAMLCLSALLTFALSALGRRIGGPALVALVAGLAAAPAPSRAAELRLHQERVVVAAGETVAGSLVVSGERVEIDGVVQGDLAVLAERLVVRGTVAGNLFAAGRHVAVEGRVEGSLFAFAERVELQGEVLGSVYTGAESYRLAAQGRVARDAVNAGHGATVEGSVGRDLVVLGDWAELRGEVGHGVDARVERLALLDGARIGGDVDVTFLSPDEDLERAPGARIGGELRTQRFEPPRLDRFERYLSIGFYFALAIELAAAFLFGVLLRWLAPDLFEHRLETAAAFFGALGWGFVAAIAAPVAILLAALTLVGIPLAILALFVLLTALYAAGIVVASLIGRTLVRADEDESVRAFSLALLAGLAVLFAAAQLPFVGGVVQGIAMLTGLGLLVAKARLAFERRAIGRAG